VTPLVLPSKEFIAQNIESKKEKAGQKAISFPLSCFQVAAGVTGRRFDCAGRTTTPPE
jgi:hypothetical protein